MQRTALAVIGGFLALAMVTPAATAQSSQLWQQLEKEFDDNGDQRITNEEYEAALSFSELDRDGDRYLTAADFEGRTRADLGAELSARLLSDARDAGGGISAASWKAYLKTLDADGSGVLDNAELSSLGTGADVAPPGAEGRRIIAHLLDRDQNGKVETKDMERVFAALDKDGDGALSATELPQLANRRPDYMEGRGQLAVRVIFRAADRDGDRAVAKDEWQGFIDALEAEEDGTFEQENLEKMMPRAWKSISPREREGLLSRVLDRNGNTKLEVEDLQSVFRDFDADGDGSLQVQELPGFRQSGIPVNS